MIGENEKFEAALMTLRGPGVDISSERNEIQVHYPFQYINIYASVLFFPFTCSRIG